MYDTGVRAFSYIQTEEPGYFRTYVREAGRRGALIGYLKRFDPGWGYRISESQPWTFTQARTRSEAARLLYSASGRLLV